MKTKKTLIALAITTSITSTFFSANLYAEESQGNTEKVEDVENIEKISVIGTRGIGRSIADSPAPVDVIDGKALAQQSSPDLNSMLRNIVPSYNVSAQPISDASTFVRPASLRGLAADHTLVLFNGKRRHRSSVINFYTAGDSDGAQGPDISVFPVIALKTVDILRDGAAAQYGSDALAGVINFRLKDAAEGGSIELRTGSNFEGDGNLFTIAANKGFALGESGFFNASLSYGESDPTDRSVQTKAAAQAEELGFSNVPNPAQVWGSPTVDKDFKSVFNMGLELSDNSSLYAFGNYASKEATNGLYHRPALGREGVYTFGDNVAIVDIDGVGVGETCPTIAATDLNGIRALSNNANCWSLHQVYEGGFTPSLTGEIEDMSFVVGVDGELDNEFTFDFSASYGRNEAAFSVDSYNTSFGPQSDTVMDAGKYTQTETNFNADFTMPLDISNIDFAMLAFGFEHRTEKFEAKAGDQHSYDIGPYGEQGFAGASQGYAGINAAAATSDSRSNYAVYVDIEGDISDNLLLTTALRYEDFDDFGSALNAKISARLDVTDSVSLRSSLSTGFKAPTPGQQNVRNISSILNAGVIELSGILPPLDSLAQGVGGKQLQPEESTSLSLGTVYSGDVVNVTIDYFNISIDDRISLSPFFTVDSPEFSSLRYYTNDFETKTQGVDLIASSSLDMANGTTDITFAANWTDTSVERHNNLSALRIKTLEDGMPSVRGNITAEHSQDDWRMLARMNYFGSHYNGHISFTDVDVSSAVTFDLEFAYHVNDNIDIIVGATNIFNTFPDEIPDEGVPINGTDTLFDTKGSWGAKYPEFAAMGINGGTYYLRIVSTFD
jgi:iron complex outermembrane receptor protein